MPRLCAPMTATNEGRKDHWLVPQDVLSTRIVVTAAFRHRRLIVITLMTTVLIVLAGILLIPARYESRLKILVKNARANVLVTPQSTNGAAYSGEVSETQINTEIELLRSRDLLEQVIKDCDLASSTLQTGGTASERYEKAARQLEKDLKIVPIKKSNVIEVTYFAKSPELPAAVLKRLADLYLDKHLRLHHTPGTYDFFTVQSKQYEGELHNAEARLSDFQQKTGLISVDQQKEIYLRKYADAKSRLHDSEAALSGARGHIARIQEQLAKTNKRVITQSRTLPNQYSVERMNTMLVELQNRRTQLLTKFQPNDRLVKEVEEQIDNTRGALKKAIGSTSIEESTDLNPLRQSLESELTKARLEEAGASASRDSLAVQVAEYGGFLSNLESGVNVYDDLKRQIKSAEGNYQLYAKKQEEARIADELDRQKITNVSIAEAPTALPSPARLSRGFALALGLFLAMLLSAGLAVTSEFFREDIQTAGELEKACGGAVLATVPFLRLPEAETVWQEERGDSREQGD